MNIIPPSYEILDALDQQSLAVRIEYSGRICYKSEDMIDQQSALIYTMVLVSASDSDMTDAELGMIGDIVRHLPAFEGFDAKQLPNVASMCVDLLSGENGLDHALEVIVGALPERLDSITHILHQLPSPVRAQLLAEFVNRLYASQ